MFNVCVQTIGRTVEEFSINCVLCTIVVINYGCSGITTPTYTNFVQLFSTFLSTIFYSFFNLLYGLFSILYTPLITKAVIF